jgi:putative component of membrane protein insertase Oxa1/YidC/SpoIIIJ protein YidD
MLPENDPRSWNYVRKYERPALGGPRVVISVILTCCASISVGLLLFRAVGLSGGLCLCAAAVFLLVIVLLRAKAIVVWCVKCYQHFAPVSIRRMCRFEPSCSEYMIMAIDKHGLGKGLRMGLDRIKRCSRKEGGFDYP